MKQVYQTHTQSLIYRSIIEHFGQFDRESWTPGSWYPKGTSAKDVESFYTNLFEKVRKHNDKHNLRRPKSWKAICNQVAWATSAQFDVNLTHEGIRRDNRNAAYLAGFMSMDDILWLEREAERRAAKNIKEAFTTSKVEDEDVNEEENALSVEPKTKGDKIMTAVRELDGGNVKYWGDFDNASDAVDEIWQHAKDRHGWVLNKSYIGYVIQGVVQYAKF